MIEKMKYVNMTGSINDLDRVIEHYLSRAEIQFENASKELSNEKELSGLTLANPYSEAHKAAEKLFKMTGMKLTPEGASDMDKQEALDYITSVSEQLEFLSKDLKKLEERRVKLKYMLDRLEPFSELDFNIYEIKDFEFIKYKFGRMPVASFKQFESYLYHEPEILFAFGKNDGEYIWGVYFVCYYLLDKYESVFSSLHFEKIDFAFDFEGEFFTGKPGEVFQEYKGRLEELDREIAETEALMIEKADKSIESLVNKKKIAEAYSKILHLYNDYDIRRYAAKTKNDYYILVGWMTEKNARAFEKEAEDDDRLVFIIEDNNDSIPSRAPTKLKNNFLVRPFEFFIRMYGLPSYNEIEPTPFVALTYTLLFGIMFGDIGQGTVLSLLGLFLTKVKKMGLGPVLIIIGISSMFFGLLFGSVFGIEFTPLLINPAEPENINSLLIGSVILGVVLILITMVFNIANGIKKKQIAEVLFDPNGFAGFLFYGTILAVAIMVVMNVIELNPLIIIFMLLLLLTIGLRHPLAEVIKGKKKPIRGGLGMFLFETFIECFEVVLSYFTNTVSFVRVGAFALSHASLMGVVRMLAGAEHGGSPNIIVMILGNLLVLGLEGLIVGIQVLRIEFYEIFSRFYDGKGREFIPLNQNKKLN